MFGISTLFVAFASLLIIKYSYQFVKNYVNATRTGLPVIVVPIEQNNPVWMVFSVMLRPYLEKYLPSRMWSRIKYTIYGWEYQEKLKPFHSLINSTANKDVNEEKTFMLSTCGRLELYTSSPTVIQQILLQPKEFQQLDITSLFMGVFGPNVLTVDGELWSKHRKIVATAVSERISPVVWGESVKQTCGLLDELCGASKSSGETWRFFDMIKTITINVLSKAGMGVAKEWTPTNTENGTPDMGNEVSYMDAVKLLNDSLTGPIIIPNRALLRWPAFMPGYKNLRRLGLAKVLFPVRTKEMLTEEKQRLTDATGRNPEGKTTLMSMLIAASDEPGESKERMSAKKALALTDEELVSNLYIFTAAGYDTTANTLAFAVTLLMRYPKWQNWILQEVDSLLGEHAEANIEDVLGNYQAIFPKCTRILAVMFETLRLFPPVIHMAKMTRKPQTLTSESGHKIVIPAETTAYVNVVGLHLDAAVWRDLNLASDDIVEDWEEDMPGRYSAIAEDIELGSNKLGDEWRFRPTRWICSTKGQAPTETLFQPPRCSFIPWSTGPRVCPGQRMAQVEFTAILLTLFSRHRLEAVAHHNENPEAMKKRLDMTMHKSFSKLTLEMDVFEKGGVQDEKLAADIKKGVESVSGIKVRLVKRKL